MIFFSKVTFLIFALSWLTANTKYANYIPFTFLTRFAILNGLQSCLHFIIRIALALPSTVGKGERCFVWVAFTGALGMSNGWTTKICASSVRTLKTHGWRNIKVVNAMCPSVISMWPCSWNTKNHFLCTCVLYVVKNYWNPKKGKCILSLHVKTQPLSFGGVIFIVHTNRLFLSILYHI